MQSLNNAYYRLEWAEDKEIEKSRVKRIIASVFKILTVIFAVIAIFSFLNIPMFAGFLSATVLSFTAVLIFDYLAGAKVFSYVYTVSDGELELKKEYKNGKTEVFLKSDLKDIAVIGETSLTEPAENFFPETQRETELNYCTVQTEENKRAKIAVDDYMLALIRRNSQ